METPIREYFLVSFFYFRRSYLLLLLHLYHVLFFPCNLSLTPMSPPIFSFGNINPFNSAIPWSIFWEETRCYYVVVSYGLPYETTVKVASVFYKFMSTQANSPTSLRPRFGVNDVSFTFLEENSFLLITLFFLTSLMDPNSLRLLVVDILKLMDNLNG